MKREEKLVKNTIILAIGTFLPRVASFVVLPILTEYLSQEEYGTYDLITVLVSLLLPAVTLQIQTAAFRFLIDVRGNREKENEIVSNIFAFTIPVTSIVLLILFFVMPGVDKGESLLICVYFLFDILVNTARQITRGLSKNIDYSVSAILGSIGRLIFAVMFVYVLRTGLYGATITLVASVFFEFLFLCIRVKILSYIKPALINVSTIKDLIAYSWPMVPNSMSMWVMRVSDRLVVTAVMGVTANAVYSVANKIPSLLSVAQSTFNMAWQENASIVSTDEDASQYYSIMFGRIFDYMAGVFGLLVASTPLLFKLLIRGNYDAAYYQMPILFIGMFCSSIFGYLGGVYVAYKKTKSVGITTIIAAGLNLLIDVCSINYIGLYAASGSTLLSYLFLCVYRMYDVQKFVNIRYNIKRILWVSGFLIIMSILCYIRNPLFNCLNIVLEVICFWILDKEVLLGILHKVQKKVKKIR